MYGCCLLISFWCRLLIRQLSVHLTKLGGRGGAHALAARLGHGAKQPRAREAGLKAPHRRNLAGHAGQDRGVDEHVLVCTRLPQHPFPQNGFLWPDDPKDREPEAGQEAGLGITSPAPCGRRFRLQLLFHVVVGSHGVLQWTQLGNPLGCARLGWGGSWIRASDWAGLFAAGLCWAGLVAGGWIQASDWAELVAARLGWDGPLAGLGWSPL